MKVGKVPLAHLSDSFSFKDESSQELPVLVQQRHVFESKASSRMSQPPASDLPLPLQQRQVFESQASSRTCDMTHL